MTPGRRVEFDTSEGTWLSLDVTPDGARIVFELLGELYGIGCEGGVAEGIVGGSMAFHSQPAISPDGRRLAFVSDRSGAENVWISNLDGSDPFAVTANATAHVFISPAWSPDGQGLCVSFYRADRNAIELWRYAAQPGGAGEALLDGAPSALGATYAPDGRSLLFAAHDGPVFEDDVVMPRWRIDRLSLRDGRRETVVANPGGAFRPRLTPDGRRLVYASRFAGRTGLRLRDLAGADDRWLVWPVDQDAQEALATRDLAPGHAFTPDGQALIVAYAGKIMRVDLATGRSDEVPFTARVARDIGPSLRLDIREDTGPLRARIISDPGPSPDGGRVVFSALGAVRAMGPDRTASEVSADGSRGFMPAWSPDGREIAYVTWTAREAGHIWVGPADGQGSARRVTDTATFYTNPVFSPDGASILALRSSHFDRMHLHMEPLFTGRAFGGLRQAELMAFPARGGPPRVIASGMMSGPAQFTDQPDVAYLLFDDGLNEVRLDGSGRRSVLQVVGPGYYFLDGPQPADDIKISPDRRWVLVQHVQQLHLLAMEPGTEPPALVDLSTPGEARRRLSRDGADFFGWADEGRTIFWALGDELRRLPLERAIADIGAPPPRRDELETVGMVVEVPRDTPRGAIVLRGATAITMLGDEVVRDCDIVIADGRIAAVGPRGGVAAPADAEVLDLTGAFITPGLIDTHAHWSAVRRGVLDFESWDLEASLAYGITAGLDPSTLTIDLLAYQDLQEAGMILGPRIYSTGVAVFSFNRFGSLEETREGLSRYAGAYRTRNLKQYRTGSRRVRQWVAMAALDLGLMPTTEGALDFKLDLTQVIDGFAGNEHALGPTRLYRDVVELLARTRVSYTPTLQCSHGGPQGLHAFVSEGGWLADAKLARFFPSYMLDRLFARGFWADRREYRYADVAAGAAEVLRAGGLVGVGSHGNVAGLGLHWEMWALAAGGLTPHEVWRAATIGSAETIGRQGELGTIEANKLADLLVLDRDPLADVRNSTALRQVMQNGRLYEAETLDELWPRRRVRARRWFADDHPNGFKGPSDA